MDKPPLDKIISPSAPPAAIPALRGAREESVEVHAAGLRAMLAPKLVLAATRMIEALDASLAGEPDHATRLAAARAIIDCIVATPLPKPRETPAPTRIPGIGWPREPGR